MNTKWQKAAESLKKGGVVIIPSESSYGIAALVSDSKAIKKLYKIKSRADNKPSLIIVGSMEQAKKLVNFSEKALKLARNFWPGGLTMVLDSKNDSLPKEIYGLDKTLAIRFPGHEELRELALEIGPFILPSANFNGEIAPYKLAEIDPKLAGMVDFVLDEETGGNNFSTLVDARGEEAIILRQGSVKILAV